jgi:predicted peptidase
MTHYSFHFLLIDLLLLVSFVFMVEGCATSGTTIKYPILPSVAVTGQHSYSRTIELDSTNQIIKVRTMNFLFCLPESYGKDLEKKWPLIRFFHGMGEREDDLELLKKHPLLKILDEQKDFSSIVVSPQLPLEKYL